MPRGRPRTTPEDVDGQEPTTPEEIREEEVSEFPGIKVYAGLGTKINVGNYESVDVSFGVSGLPIDASDEYLQAAAARAIGRLESLLEPMFDQLATRIEGVKRGYRVT